MDLGPRSKDVKKNAAMCNLTYRGPCNKQRFGTGHLQTNPHEYFTQLLDFRNRLSGTAVLPNRKLGRISANCLWIHTKLATCTLNPVFHDLTCLASSLLLAAIFLMIWWSIKSLFAASLNIFPQNVLKQNAHKQKRKIFSELLQFAREHLTKNCALNSQKKLISQSCAMLTWSCPKQKQAQQPTAMGNSLSGAYTVYVQIQRTPPPPPKEAQNC